MTFLPGVCDCAATAKGLHVVLYKTITSDGYPILLVGTWDVTEMGVLIKNGGRPVRFGIFSQTLSSPSQRVEGIVQDVSKNFA